MIIWSGYGFVVILVVFFFGLSAEWILEWFFQDDQFYQTHDLIRNSLLFYPALILFFLGKWMNRKHPSRHTLFFIPVEYWGIIVGGLAIAFLLSDFISS